MNIPYNYLPIEFKNNNGCFTSRVKHNKKEFMVDIKDIDW